MAWQGKGEPLAPYVDTFDYQTKRSSKSKSMAAGADVIHKEERFPKVFSPTCEVAFPKTLQELASLFATDEEMAAEIWALKEQFLQEKVTAKDQEIEALKEKHQLACENLLRRKEQEIKDVLNEESLQQQDLDEKVTEDKTDEFSEAWTRVTQKLQEQSAAKERESMLLREESRFHQDELMRHEEELSDVQQKKSTEEQLEEQLAAKEAEIAELKEMQLRKEQEMKEIRHEERLENEENAHALEKKLQEQLAEKDILIDALKEESRMKQEEIMRIEMEMKEALQDEQLRNQEIRDMLQETEKTSNLMATKEKDTQEKLAEKDLEIEDLRKEFRLQHEEIILLREQEIEDLQKEASRKQEKAAEKWSLKQQVLQEKVSAKDQEIEALKEKHQLACENLLRRKEQEIKDVLNEESLQQQDLDEKVTEDKTDEFSEAWTRVTQKLQEQSAAKERESMLLREESRFHQDELMRHEEELSDVQQKKSTEEQLEEQLAAKEAEIAELKEMQLRKEQEMKEIRHEERLENEENAHALEKKLQEQLAEKDILIDALKEESRMKQEEIMRIEMEMKEALQDEQLRNQEIRDMLQETEKTSNLMATKEKDTQEKLAEKDLEIEDLRKEFRLQHEEMILLKEQEIEDLQKEASRKQEQIAQKDLQIEMLSESQLQREELLIQNHERIEEISEERAHKQEVIQKLQAEIQLLKEDHQSLDEISSREAEVQGLLAEERKRTQELQAEMCRFSEQNTAQAFEKAQFELELAEVSNQKVSLEAQLATLIQRLDEEQAERIRQGARAESLERDLEALHALHAEEQEEKRGHDSQTAWLRLVQRAATEADVSSLRTSQRCLQSELLKLRAQNAKECAQMADLTTYVDENEKLLNANRELSTSLQQFKQENEQLQIDNRSLLESVALFEADLEKVSDRHAQLIGHVNKKQKIRYTVKLKEECAQLRLDLNKARHRLHQLEGTRRTDSLFGALASLGYDASQNESRLQECALERVNSDFQHLVSLVQSAIGDGVERSTADFGELLQVLRSRTKESKEGHSAEIGRVRKQIASPMQSPAKVVEIKEKSEKSVARNALFFEDQENLGANQNHEDSDQLREAKKALMQINQCIGSGRKLYGQPVADSWGFFRVLQRKGGIDRKDVCQGLKRLDCTLSQTSMDALIHALDSGYLGSWKSDAPIPETC